MVCCRVTVCPLQPSTALVNAAHSRWLGRTFGFIYTRRQRSRPGDIRQRSWTVQCCRYTVHFVIDLPSGVAWNAPNDIYLIHGWLLTLINSQRVGFPRQLQVSHKNNALTGQCQTLLRLLTDRDGLRPGDKLLEVNSVNFQSIACSSAVAVLTGSRQLTVKLHRLGKIPEFKTRKERLAWWEFSKHIYEFNFVSTSFEV